MREQRARRQEGVMIIDEIAKCGSKPAMGLM